MDVAGRSRSHSTTSTLSSLINTTQTPPLNTHIEQFQGDIDPALKTQQKVRPPSPQDFLRPSSTNFNSGHSHQTDHHADQQPLSYPDSNLTYNIHFNHPPPLFAVSSSIYAAPPMSAHPKSPFSLGAYNAGPTTTLSPPSQHARVPPAVPSPIDARRGPPTPLPFTNPYSAGYYLSTGLTPLYTSTQFRVGGDPFFGAMSHLTPTPSCSTFIEAAQQDYTTYPLHRPQPLRMNDPNVMQESRLAPVAEGAESPVKSETDNVASKVTSDNKHASQSPSMVQQNQQVPSTASSQENQQSAPRFAQGQMPVHGQYAMNAPSDGPARPAHQTGNYMPSEYSAPQPLPNFMTSGHSMPLNGHQNRLPSVSFPGSAPVFNHHPQTYSVFFGPDGQPHYIPNAMPHAIADINGNLTYAYPPQAFQPTQAMSHHAWARQQNAFAYHYGDDVEMDAPTPEHRHSVASPNGNVSRSPAGRYSARAEDAEGEDDDGQYAMPRASIKRSRSLSMSSVSVDSAAGDVEWQPTRKSAKKTSSAAGRKAVDTKRMDGRKALMQIHGEVDDRVRYTSNAEDKQTDRLKRECFTCGSRDPPSWRRSCLNIENILCNRCGIYEKTHGIARPFPLDEIPNPPPRNSTASKKRKKSVKELGLKSLHITTAPRMNGINVSSVRNDTENVTRRAGQIDTVDDSESDEEENRRVSLNSNKSAGVASTASELTASTTGPRTPHSLDEMSPHHAGPRAKASAIYVQPGDMSYRAFNRPPTGAGKKGAKAFAVQSKAKKVGRPGHQRKRSPQGVSEEESE